MRLAAVRRGRTLVDRLRLAYLRLRTGELGTDFDNTMRYRPDLFGSPFGAYVQAVRSHSGEWTIGEQQLFATVASQMLKCQFCMSVHREGAVREMPPAVVDAVLEDWRSAPIPERLKAVIGLYEKLTDAPSDLGPDDIAPLRAAGLSDAAILEAVHIRTVFSIMTRVADALGFEVPPAKVLQDRARRGRPDRTR